jgi:4-hydroxy-tetrahydrodipicolinate reductase
MGSMVAREIIASGDLVLAGGVEIETHGGVGKKLCEAWGEGDAEVRVRKDLGELDGPGYDVLVDFSVPAQAVVCAEEASRNGAGLVIGTTGLTELQTARVQKAAESCAVVVAPNTSLGVNLLFALAGRVREALGEGFDVEIVEAHHRNKRDAPSGTAARLVEILSQARGADAGRLARFGRSGVELTRDEDEIGVHSLRGGGVVGRHSLHFISDLEEVTLAHEALSRQAFARGALRAVRFVYGRPHGLYDMTDVLGLRSPEPAPAARSGGGTT